MQSQTWLPLTEYALRSGISISTLRRKIKSNGIDFRMEEGRYLIRADEMVDDIPNTPFASHEIPAETKTAKNMEAELPKYNSAPASVEEPRKEIKKENDLANSLYLELKKTVDEMAATRGDESLRWRALEARVSGLAKKLEIYSEQMAELKMLVKIFEEKLDNRG